MTLMVFSASWCGPCKQYKPIVDEVVEVTGVPALRVDIDDYPETTDDWGVTSVPTTIVLDRDGVELDRLVGVKTFMDLYDVVRPF